MKCLDSNILIDILRGDKYAEKIVDDLDEEGGAVTTVINAYEILFGANKSYDKDNNVKEARRLLSKFDILSMNTEAAEIASDIHARLSKEGNLIDIRDIFIGAIALSHGCNTLITRNEKDFSRIKGLKIQKL